MKKIFISILLLFILFANQLAAQIPGYLGKKNFFMLNYFSNLALSESPYDIKQNKEFGNKNGIKIGINHKLGFEAGRVIARNKAIVFHYNRGRTAFTNIIDDQKRYYRGISADGKETILYYNCFQQASINEFYLGSRFFPAKLGSLAPMGFYYEPYAGYLNSNTNVVTSKVYDDIQSYSPKVFNGPRQTLEFQKDVAFMLIGMEIGTSYIIKEKWMLNISGNMSRTLNTFPIPFEYFSYTDPDWRAKEQKYENSSTHYDLVEYRIKNLNAFILKIGLGYIF